MGLKNEFSNLLEEKAATEGIELTKNDVNQMRIYFEVLNEWNQKIDLTSLTDTGEIVIKHFLDSLMLLKHLKIPVGAKLIDVGTGAGFPGLVLKIMRPDLHVSLLDSLNKRLRFIAEVKSALNIRNLELMHFRAETAGKMELYREKFDFAVARAVAPMVQLLEYCVPFVKMQGIFVAMKSKKAEEEVDLSENASIALGTKLEKVTEYVLPENMYRCLVLYKKFHSTPKRYPRQTGQIRKKILGEVKVNA